MIYIPTKPPVIGACLMCGRRGCRSVLHLHQLRSVQDLVRKAFKVKRYRVCEDEEMGWNGSVLANDVWKLVKKHVPTKDRKALATALIERFDLEDADDWEATDPICRAAGMYQDDEE